MLTASGVARLVLPVLLLSYGFLSFLTPSFSAVGDLGQKLPDAFNILLGPRMHAKVADCNDLRRGDFSGSDIPAQRGGIDSQFLGSFARRKGLWHFSIIVAELNKMSRDIFNPSSRGRIAKCKTEEMV